MKTVLVAMLLGLGVSNLAHARGELYQKSIGIADLMYLQERNLDAFQASKISDLFEEIETIVKNPELRFCGDSNEIFQQSYLWAVSHTGPNLSRAEAQRFSDQVSRQMCPAKFFEVYKETFVWAISHTGLNKARAQGQEFSQRVAEYAQEDKFRKDTLDCLKTQFAFATSHSGMNLSRSEGEEFALERCMPEALQ